MFRTSAAGSVGGLAVDYSPGVQPGTLITAADFNVKQEELAHLCESVGWALDAADNYQVARSVIALSRPIGAMLESEIKLTPITVAASKSQTNPSFPLYNPVIARTADVDVPSTQAPDLVTAFRAFAAEVVGTSSFTATIAGSVLTFANTTVNNQLLAALLADAMVQRWLSSGQSATYDASGGDFSNWRCINVAGTDYVITAINTGARTITVTGSPATGSQTVIFYPYRIAGSSTSVRLHKLSGFVPVAQGEVDGLVVAGLRIMDTFMAHWHSVQNGSTSGGSRIFPSATGSAGQTPSDLGSVGSTFFSDATTIKTDGANGTPRPAKNTSPRTHSRYFYTWAGRLLT